MFGTSADSRSRLNRWRLVLFAIAVLLSLLAFLRMLSVDRAIDRADLIDKDLLIYHEIDRCLEKVIASIEGAQAINRQQSKIGDATLFAALNRNRDESKESFERIRSSFKQLGIGSASLASFELHVQQKFENIEALMRLPSEDGVQSQTRDVLRSKGKKIDDELSLHFNRVDQDVERFEELNKRQFSEALTTIRRNNTTTGWVAIPIFILVAWLAFKVADSVHRNLDAQAQTAKNLEDEVNRRTQELQSAKVELEAFSYSISHDLRTPLRAIVSYSAILEEDYGDRLDAEAIDYLARIKASGKRMNEIIDTMLMLSRLSKSEINIESQDVSAVVQNLWYEYHQNGLPVKAKLNLEPGILVQADRKLLTTLLDNLLKNAIKFSSRVSEPVVSVVFDISAQAIVVRDNGVGFNQEFASNLFKPFHRLHNDREFEGTGIGLAIVDRIAKKHGGSVWAAAEEGKGATFFVQFPPKPTHA